MIPELGHFALILAFAVAIVQGTLPLIGASRGDARLMALGRTAALTQQRYRAGVSSALDWLDAERTRHEER